MPRRTQYRVQSQIEMRNSIPKKDNIHIVTCIPHRLVTATEKVKDRIKKIHDYHRKSHSKQNIQYKHIAQDALRSIVVFLPKLDRDQCSSSHAHQRPESRRKVH